MDLQQAYTDMQTLVLSMKSVVLSTIDDGGKPYTSYAPFGMFDGDYYIIISNMAKHTKYLRQRPIAGLLWIEDESKAQSVFFRKRLYLETAITLDITNHDVISMMTERFGDAVKSFLSMDFTIVKCTPIQGQLVLGAGSAFEVNGKALEPIRGSGHRPSKS